MQIPLAADDKFVVKNPMAKIAVSTKMVEIENRTLRNRVSFNEVNATHDSLASLLT